MSTGSPTYRLATAVVENNVSVLSTKSAWRWRLKSHEVGHLGREVPKLFWLERLVTQPPFGPSVNESCNKAATKLQPAVLKTTSKPLWLTFRVFQNDVSRSLNSSPGNQVLFKIICKKSGFLLKINSSAWVLCRPIFPASIDEGFLPLLSLWGANGPAWSRSVVSWAAGKPSQAWDTEGLRIDDTIPKSSWG